MNPNKLAKSNSEDAHQAALFSWSTMALRHGLKASLDEKCYDEVGYAIKNYPLSNELVDLVTLFAIPNGGLRDKITAARLKATGVKAGYPDIGLDTACGNYHGLRIELKRPKTTNQSAGIVSDDQNFWLNILNARGYLAVVCYGWEEARDQIIRYLEA